MTTITITSSSSTSGGEAFCKRAIKIMYLLTKWEGRTGKYLVRGPCVLTESQIFSRPA